MLCDADFHFYRAALWKYLLPRLDDISDNLAFIVWLIERMVTDVTLGGAREENRASLGALKPTSTY
jgi:hypothetical protein